MITIYTLTAGFAWFGLQVLHQEWKKQGRWFQKDLGSADRVFPKFTGEYFPDRSVRPRKHIYQLR
jgi:hypothetical protein